MGWRFGFDVISIRLLGLLGEKFFTIEVLNVYERVVRLARTRSLIFELQHLFLTTLLLLADGKDAVIRLQSFILFSFYARF